MAKKIYNSKSVKQERNRLFKKVIVKKMYNPSGSTISKSNSATKAIKKTLSK